MNISQAFAIPASGLDAQRERLNIISSNLANVDSTQTPEGGGAMLFLQQAPPKGVLRVHLHKRVVP